MTNKIAVYPGSFDPITNGHIDIVERASELFDKVIVGLLINSSKVCTFTASERVNLIMKSTQHIKNVEVQCFSGLLVDFMEQNYSNIAIRGLRAVSDLEYEFQMAHNNRLLYPEMETIFLMPDFKYTYLSSSVIREVYNRGSELKSQVPECVHQEFIKKASI